MVMFYKDMSTCAVQNGHFRFKIPKKLGHFGMDYDHFNPTHQISIELATASAATDIKEIVIPLVKQLGGGTVVI